MEVELGILACYNLRKKAAFQNIENDFNSWGFMRENSGLN
jgi:hypothetical protein